MPREAEASRIKHRLETNSMAATKTCIRIRVKIGKGLIRWKTWRQKEGPLTALLVNRWRTEVASLEIPVLEWVVIRHLSTNPTNNNLIAKIKRSHTPEMTSHRRESHIQRRETRSSSYRTSSIPTSKQLHFRQLVICNHKTCPIWTRWVPTISVPPPRANLTRSISTIKAMVVTEDPTLDTAHR